jgi:hypothetical protein
MNVLTVIRNVGDEPRYSLMEGSLLLMVRKIASETSRQSGP